LKENITPDRQAGRQAEQMYRQAISGDSRSCVFSFQVLKLMPYKCILANWKRSVLFATSDGGDVSHAYKWK
jgi:hypothetical protein